MRPIRLREHDTIAVAPAYDAAQKQVTPPQARALHAACAQSGALRFSSESQLKASEIVGVVAAAGAIVEVLPKIDGLDEAGAGLNLVRMLIDAGLLPLQTQDLSAMDWRRTDLLEVVIRAFAMRLEREARRGLSRRYVAHAEDLSKLRGRIDLVRQFTRHAVSPQRLACRFDEFSEDTPLNRALRCALSLASGLCRSAVTRRLTLTCLALFDGVSPLPATQIDWSAIQIDRTNTRFKTLAALARLILSGLRQTTGAGAHHGYALLFDMNVLFEAYIGRQVSRALPGRVRLQGPPGWVLRDLETDTPAFQTRPDISVLDPTGNVIIDTKWKRLDASERLLKVSQDDIYQMMAYAQVYKPRRLILLYPHHEGLEGTTLPRRYRLTGSDAMLETRTIALTDLSRTQILLRQMVEDQADIDANLVFSA